MKIDIEKLICFLMSDEVIENNIPESLKLGLKEQGYKYEDGKICPLQEEPVSEGLEDAANEWDAKASFTPFYMVLDDNNNPNGVRQDYITHAESFKAGAKWQKEQLMAKGVDGKVIANGMGNPILHLWDKGRHLIGKKVKVIIIKED